MAGTTTRATETGMVGSDLYVLRREYNKLVDDAELLRAQLALTQAKVNAIITAAATNIAAVAAVPALTLTAVDAAADLTAAKVADNNGVTT